MFWASFAGAELLLLLILSADFSLLNFAGASLVVVLGSWKLAEDAKARREGDGRGVRRDLLKRLKNPRA
jgi:membrane protein implicated in regulation of membrane protease activity